MCLNISRKLPDISRPQFHLPSLGVLAWWHAWRRLVAKVGTSNPDRTISLKRLAERSWKISSIDILSRNVGKELLRNSPEGRKSLLHRGVSLKSSTWELIILWFISCVPGWKYYRSQIRNKDVPYPSSFGCFVSQQRSSCMETRNVSYTKCLNTLN